MNSSEIDALYRQYGSILLRRARAILSDDSAAQDAVQEVFMRVIHSHHEFRKESSPLTWLYRITTNHCLNRIRDTSRRQRIDAARGDDREEASFRGRSITDERLLLREVLPFVSEELCEVAVYYYVDQMRQDEIAGVLGTSRRTVGNRLEAFRQAAAAVLGHDASRSLS